MDNNKIQFNLEHQFKLYLQRVGLPHLDVRGIQYRETKRAFFGACGQMLDLMRSDVADLPEENAIIILEDMWNQVGNFWLKQNGKGN